MYRATFVIPPPDQLQQHCCLDGGLSRADYTHQSTLGDMALSLPIFLLLHRVPVFRTAIQPTFIPEICDMELNMPKAYNLSAKYELHLHLPLITGLINLFLQ